MPRWGRPPGARLGRRTRRRATQWEDDMRIEEIESADDDYAQGVLLDDSSFDPRRDPRRREWRRRNYEYEGEAESSDGIDYNLDSDADSTVAYAIQLAMRDKEEQLVDKALERIRRAQMMGKKNVRLSQQELDALERRRMQTGGAKGSQRKNGGSRRSSFSDKRKSKTERMTNGASDKAEKRRSVPGASEDQYAAQRLQFNDETYGSWGRARGIPSGYYSSPGVRPSSSSSQRPRTPSSHSLRPQQANTPPHPQYQPQFPQRYASVSETRPHSSSQYQSFPRPLPDDPQWAPRQRSFSNVVPYPPEYVTYQSYVPMDPRYGYHVRRDASGSTDASYQPNHRSFSDETYPSNTSDPTSPRRTPIESSSEDSISEEDDEDVSEDDGEDDVRVEVVERPAPTGYQTRSANGVSAGRGSRQRRGRRK